MSKVKYMRLKPATMRAFRMWQKEIEGETGDTITDDETLYTWIKKHRPDLIEKAEEIEATHPDSD